MNRTYPTGSIQSNKLPLLPSRIPISSKRKEQDQADSGKLLPPLVSNRQDTNTNTIAQAVRRRHTQYSEKPVKKTRDDSAKYKLRLAEKDQRILETHEYIQVCTVTSIIFGCIVVFLAVSTNEINSL